MKYKYETIEEYEKHMIKRKKILSASFFIWFMNFVLLVWTTMFNVFSIEFYMGTSLICFFVIAIDDLINIIKIKEELNYEKEKHHINKITKK
jgi:hypothetical protein